MNSKLLIVFLFLGSSFLYGQATNKKVSLDTLINGFKFDSILQKQVKGDFVAYSAFYANGRIVKLNQSVLHHGVKSFDYYFLENELAVVHVTHTQAGFDNKQDTLVDTRYYLNEGRIFRKSILAGKRFSDYTAKDLFKDVKQIRTLLTSKEE